MNPKVPTLYEWLGGAEALDRLIARFYEKVPADPLLEPLFATRKPFTQTRQNISCIT